MNPKSKGIPAAAFFAGRSFHQALPIIPSAYADPIETGPLTDERSVEPMTDLDWSPAQVCRRVA